MEVIEEELICRDVWFSFTNASNDGRLNSIKDEDVVLDWLFGLESLKGRITRKKHNRDTADFWLDDIPMNIKVSAYKNSQFNNVSSVPSLFAHCMNKKVKTNTDVARYVNEIYANGFLSVDVKKYGLLIVCKTEKKFWVGTFDELHEDDIYVNPSNGFQVRSIPERYVKRNNMQYVSFFLRKVDEYYKKIAEPYLIMSDFE